jgi:NADH-quinone oxidoreductase subunit N
MFFSLIPKLVLVFLFSKLYIFFFSVEPKYINFIFILIGFLSLFIGIINAMYQIRIKRFLAYSAIANVGFIFLSLSVCNFSGIFSSIFFVMCYMFSVVLIFIFLNLYRKDYKFNEFINIHELSLLNNSNFQLAFFIALIFFSFAGIPPMIGFFGKFVIFISLANDYNYFILLLILLINIISGFYYVRIVRFIFFNNVNERIVIMQLCFSELFIFFSVINLNFIFFFDIFAENIFFSLVTFYL